MKKSHLALAAGITAMTATSLVAAPASAADPNIVEVVLDVSGPSGFDADGFDYDILRDALLATDLAGAVAATDDITVFAPNDWAMIRLARDLGYKGWDEGEAFSFIAEFTGYASAADPGLLDDVLLYHVAPGARTQAQLNDQSPIATLQGGTVSVEGNVVSDNDPDADDAAIYGIRDVAAANGIIQNVSRVLRPIDLEREPTGSVVDLVLSISGPSGTDADGFDYDLLRDALVATDLADAVATADDITVFAPNDWAMIRLARDLGYAGWDEAGAFGFIAVATEYVSPADPGLLDDVLLYHVAPGAKTIGELRAAGEVKTLLAGSTIAFGRLSVIDNDPDAEDAMPYGLYNVHADNGIIHNISRVLRPIDL